jgi:hypothetical protein
MANKRASFSSKDIGGPPKDEPWCWYTAEMLKSDAWRDLSINGRRMLDRLEIEHMAHGRFENGNLIVTYDDFVASGIRRAAVCETIAELERLGWTEVQRGGYRGFARSWPHRFRLTHRRTRIIPQIGAPYMVGPTHDWRRYRSKKSDRMVPKQEPSQYRNRNCNGSPADLEVSEKAAPRNMSSVTRSPPLYISRVEGGVAAGLHAEPPKGRARRALVPNRSERRAFNRCIPGEGMSSGMRKHHPPLQSDCAAAIDPSADRRDDLAAREYVHS